ncbi:WD40-repeat-containing domain protein [Mycena alexandri]|uniref:WD40-repeat-containing domain protein n=1 Tax=Mycena alexandri TaxID=1745969 RepID=A0AAD6X7P8_9AGAR|nr:WD40-repeat-containing domain protein [Mycena alexandri]
MSYSLHRTLTPSPATKAGPVNTLLFFEDGNLLASGGDDQILRIWNIESGECRQELRDSHWGQITCLNLMRDSSSEALDLFIGTGRGVVSEFVRHTGRLNSVFKLDEAVEAQDVNPTGSKFAVASIQGQIKLYDVQDRTSLVPLWTFQADSAPPRSILFLGDSNEQLVVHNLKPGPILYLNAINGRLIPQSHELRGGVGSVAISPDRCKKAIHNISTDRFDLYGSGPSDPVGLKVSTSSGKIKGATFGEGGKTLVCGGDDGFIHIFDVLKGVERESSALSSDCSTVYALADSMSLKTFQTCTTKEYYLIASGGSALPAAINILKKPTEYKEAIDRSAAIERETAAARDRQRTAEEANAAKEAQQAREAKASQDAEAADLARRCEVDDNENTTMSVALVCIWVAAAMVLAKIICCHQCGHSKRKEFWPKLSSRVVVCLQGARSKRQAGSKKGLRLVLLGGGLQRHDAEITLIKTSTTPSGLCYVFLVAGWRVMNCFPVGARDSADLAEILFWLLPRLCGVAETLRTFLTMSSGDSSSGFLYEPNVSSGVVDPHHGTELVRQRGVHLAVYLLLPRVI